MKNSARSLVLFLAATGTVLIGIGQARAVSQEDESVGGKIKKLFASPTPSPHKKHKASPSPSASPKKKASPKPSPSAKPSPSPTASESPKSGKSPSPSHKATSSPEPSDTPTETPHRKKGSAPAESSKTGSKRRHPKVSAEGETSPTPDETETPPTKRRSPTPSPTPTETETPTPTPTEAASPSVSPSKGKGTRGPVATVSASEIVGFENNPTEVRQLLERALKLTAENLDYKYGSADPANGGMDCSGFIYYVLSQGGMKEVPRDASQQYIWLRKAGTFQAVLGRHDDTFELEALKPGDLLFWSGTYRIERDPPITHTMIYLGREKGTNQRIMVGSSDGRSYRGQSRFGVSVFDFKVTSRGAPDKSQDHLTPSFVGYGRIPNLRAPE